MRPAGFVVTGPFTSSPWTRSRHLAPAPAFAMDLAGGGDQRESSATRTFVESVRTALFQVRGGIGCRRDSASSARRQTRALTHPRRPHRPGLRFLTGVPTGCASSTSMLPRVMHRCGHVMMRTPAGRNFQRSHTVGTMAHPPHLHTPASRVQPHRGTTAQPRLHAAGGSATPWDHGPVPVCTPAAEVSASRVAGQVPAVAASSGARAGEAQSGGRHGRGGMNRPPAHSPGNRRRMCHRDM